MKLVYFADQPDALMTIAKWYFDEWGYLGAGTSVDEVAGKIHVYLNRDRIPLMILATEEDEPVGVVQLKFREMDIYPEKEHWLGGVYVAAQHRGKGIASKLINKALADAKSLGVEILHLQTELLNAGLYRSLGWQPLEQVNYHGLDVLVMEQKLS